jgi:hypothetical protein
MSVSNVVEAILHLVLFRLMANALSVLAMPSFSRQKRLMLILMLKRASVADLCNWSQTKKN